MVFEGKQGVGKSEGLKVLAGGDEFFTDFVSLRHTSKELMEQTSGKWIVEVPELDGMTRSEVEHVKAVLSRTHDRARAAYAHLPTEIGRQFIMVATTNMIDGEARYLRDLSGNRRFLPVRVGDEIDLKLLKRDREQLFAEAVMRERAGRINCAAASSVGSGCGTPGRPHAGRSVL